MSIYDTKGRIFNIQRFSIHDGPGIRTIVFFKGCFMRCAWCCNPESQSYDIQYMVENGKEKIVGQDVTVGEIMPEVLADRAFFRRSGGGVTLSGGEILGQPEFARDLLCACKENGLHTAVESTANAPFENIAKILPYLDLYLMDIKHMDSVKHEEYTGAKNENQTFLVNYGTQDQVVAASEPDSDDTTTDTDSDDNTTSTGADPFLLASSIAIAVVLLFAIASIIFRKVWKKARKNIVANKRAPKKSKAKRVKPAKVAKAETKEEIDEDSPYND